MSELTEPVLPVEETDDSCRPQYYIEIVPLTRDGPCTTKCDSGDWSAEVKQENFPGDTGSTDILHITGQLVLATVDPST